MKRIYLAAFLFFFFFSTPSIAGNFLHIRSEYVNPEEGEGYVSTYNYYIYSWEKWNLCFELFTGDKGFWDGSVGSNYKLIPEFSVGLKASVNELGEERLASVLGLSLDFNRLFESLEKGKHMACLAYTQELFNSDRLTDLWTSYSYNWRRLRLMGEAGYYFNGDGPEHFYLRPIKIGIFVNQYTMPFIMYEMSWMEKEVNGWGKGSDSVSVGVIVIW